MNASITNYPQIFSITYAFFDESHETEIAMLVNGDNILSFKRNGQELTTRWNLDELIKDINAREFDTDDEEEFDSYYDKLDEWNLRHRWHPASGGAILADLYFQLIGDNVEISWNNQDAEEGVEFKYKLGGVRIPREKFSPIVESFLKEYAEHWF